MVSIEKVSSNLNSTSKLDVFGVILTAVLNFCIPRKLVSRTSVKSVLEEAVTQKFYLKATDKIDNRRRVYSINKKYDEEIINLMVRYQDIFKEIDIDNEMKE